MEFLIPIGLVVLVIAIGVAVFKSRGNKKVSTGAADRVKQQADANAILASMTQPKADSNSFKLPDVGPAQLGKASVVAQPTQPAPVVVAVDPFKVDWDAFTKGYREAHDFDDFQLILNMDKPVFSADDLPNEFAGGFRFSLPIRGVLPDEEVRFEAIAYKNPDGIVQGKRGQWSGIFLGKVENGLIVFHADSKEAGDMDRLEVRLLDISRGYRATRTIQVEQ